MIKVMWPQTFCTPAETLSQGPAGCGDGPLNVRQHQPKQAFGRRGIVCPHSAHQDAEIVGQHAAHCEDT